MAIKFTKRRNVRRVLRIGAFTLGTGLAFLGAGNIWDLGPIVSAGIGATGALIALTASLFFIFAVDDGVSDEKFDNAINSAVESVRSKTDKDT